MSSEFQETFNGFLLSMFLAHLLQIRTTIYSSDDPILLIGPCQGVIDRNMLAQQVFAVVLRFVAEQGELLIKEGIFMNRRSDCCLVSSFDFICVLVRVMPLLAAWIELSTTNSEPPS
jgi:hypothetical protein